MKHKTRLSIAILTLSLICLKAIASSSSEIENLIIAEMQARHPVDSKAFWLNMGPEALPVIQKLLEKAQEPREKFFLVDGLGYFDSPSSRQSLEKVLSGVDNDLVKKRAIGAAVRSQGEAALPLIEPYIQSENPHLRLAVYQSIKRFLQDQKSAQDLLKKALKKEKESWVKLKTEETLSEDRTRVRATRSVYQEDLKAKPSLKELSEAQLEGEWKGLWIVKSQSQPATLRLKLINAKAKEQEQKWKIEIKLKGKPYLQLKDRECVVVHELSQSRYWLQVKASKMDAVFISNRE